ncbi:MAG: hypothetical protein VX673_05880 [Pseudomonadota bacterium]|jgi:hypothetical protein|nr:hypothetical protein [Pseudomonadota bacterium]|tara:strand:- start:163 stop:399 length:237 start_codon:yes stop_codon:yes gene_type:complete
MSKALIKEAVGILPGGHEYDMRPRYDADTYIQILNLAKEMDMKPNVLLRLLTKLQLERMRDEGRETVIKSIIRLQSQN